MNHVEQFEKEVKENISRIGADRTLQYLSLKWVRDIDIRSHNRAAIEAHPLAHIIDMIQSYSIASYSIALDIIGQAQSKATARSFVKSDAWKLEYSL